MIMSLLIHDIYQLQRGHNLNPSSSERFNVWRENFKNVKNAFLLKYKNVLTAQKKTMSQAVKSVNNLFMTWFEKVNKRS